MSAPETNTAIIICRFEVPTGHRDGEDVDWMVGHIMKKPEFVNPYIVSVEVSCIDSGYTGPKALRGLDE
jgi:hypothetical protein